jgi:hypothetical protein
LVHNLLMVAGIMATVVASTVAAPIIWNADQLAVQHLHVARRAERFWKIWTLASTLRAFGLTFVVRSAAPSLAHVTLVGIVEALAICFVGVGSVVPKTGPAQGQTIA